MIIHHTTFKIYVLVFCLIGKYAAESIRKDGLEDMMQIEGGRLISMHLWLLFHGVPQKNLHENELAKSFPSVPHLPMHVVYFDHSAIRAHTAFLYTVSETCHNIFVLKYFIPIL